MTSALADEKLDDFSDLSPEDIEAGPAPVTGTRGTRDRASPDKPQTPRQPRGTRLQKKLDQLQARLSAEMFTGGTIVGLALPVTGYYTCQQSHAFTSAVVDLASSRPEWVEALEKLADIGPGLTVGRTVIGLGAALAVDRGRADPEHQVMKLLGVYAAYQAVQEKREPGEVSDAVRYSPPPAGAFVPVS